MKITLTALLFIALISFTNKCMAQLVQVELYNQFDVKTVVVIPIEGKYRILSKGGKILKLKKNNIVYFTQVGDSVSVWDSDQHIGMFSSISFLGTAKENILKVESVFPALEQRRYEGDLTIEVKNQNLLLKNLVDINSYLAGVVEAESGPNAPFEFYKTQAIISRTYLYDKIYSAGKNYKIGDDVNFQVYKGMCHRNLNIKQAVLHTKGLVIIDSAKQLITAVFHSNSGGTTTNSEDYWISSLPYLRSVDDPFSVNQINSVWTDSIKLKSWIAFFEKNNFPTNNDSLLAKIKHINPPERTKMLKIYDDSIAFRQFRTEFRLRSSWFTANLKDNGYVVLNGFGYGHGVGLSQVGAMQMARQNYSFIDIINFYYKNVKVVHINKVQ